MIVFVDTLTIFLQYRAQNNYFTRYIEKTVFQFAPTMNFGKLITTTIACF